jgi:hypothetical protein
MKIDVLTSDTLVEINRLPLRSIPGQVDERVGGRDDPDFTQELPRELLSTKTNWGTYGPSARARASSRPTNSGTTHVSGSSPKPIAP